MLRILDKALLLSHCNKIRKTLETLILLKDWMNLMRQSILAVLLQK